MADDRRRRLVPAVLAALAAVLLLGTGVLAMFGGLGSPEVPRARTAGTTAATDSVAAVGPLPSARPGRTARSRTASSSPRTLPVAVVVPALGVEARVEPIDLRGRELTPPADPTRIGWWAGGARPGAPAGTAVLTGHTVHTGGGAFDRLEDLARGDEVSVRTSDGAVAYEVRSVRVLSRDQLARRSAAVFAQSGAPRLVLVTCEDWDGAAYRSNVVVTAEPVA